MKRTAFLLTVVLLFAACSPPGGDAGGPHTIAAAVLYSGAGPGGWQDCYSHLEQSLLANMTVEAVDFHEELPLSAYDVLYLDVSLLSYPGGDAVRGRITEYVKNGGAVFTDNAFYDFFDPAFFGASSFVKLDALPDKLTLSKDRRDYNGLRTIVNDFHALYRGYADYKQTLAGLDYGYAMICGKTAEPLVGYKISEEEEIALYALNRYGKGLVLFTNPLLPNAFSANGFDMLPGGGPLPYFINSTASANQIIRSEFAALVSREKYGFSAQRVFGAFGRPSMAWQLHYEEIDGIANDSAILFSELCKEYDQPSSLTLVRNAVSWATRYESVTYLPNLSDGGGLRFDMDGYENAYGAGLHVVSDGVFLSLARLENAGAGFTDYSEYDLRAYPYVADITGDGTMDVLAGSSDGLFHFYPGTGDRDRFTVGGAQLLIDADGRPLSVPAGFSAPVLYDVDGDSVLDLVSGSADGFLYWFRGTDDPLGFVPMGVWFDPGYGEAQIFPAVLEASLEAPMGAEYGDLLLIGSNVGRLAMFQDSKMMYDLTEACSGLGHWLAPASRDGDIYVGTFEGHIAYLAPYRQQGTFYVDSYLEGTELNFKGDNRLLFRNNCVPFFADVNGDGHKDLIVGQLEVGLAYPIDSPYFPHPEAIDRLVEYYRGNGYSLGMHYMTHEYASAEREKTELAYHKAALEYYGIDTGFLGANNHTWHTSGRGPVQTYMAQYQAGLLWNLGAKTPGNSVQGGPETVLSFPYYLTDGGAKTMLLMNIPTLFISDNYTWLSITGRSEMPISAYYHCDNMYRDAERKEQDIRTFSAFARRFVYNPVTEEQLVKTVAAAYNMRLSVTGRTGSNPDLTFTAAPGPGRNPLLDPLYEACTGLKITFSDDIKSFSIATDADVFNWVNGSLYIGLNKPVKVTGINEPQDGAHIARINLPANIEQTASGAVVTFLEGGMMQLTVTDGLCRTFSEGWTTRHTSEGTMFTKHGGPSSIELHWDKSDLYGKVG